MSMENLGLAMPKLVVTDSNWVSIAIQAVVFLAVLGILIYMITVYFKNMELKANPDKNQAEIEANLAKLEKIKKWFVKIGGIAFGVVILAIIILSNFM